MAWHGKYYKGAMQERRYEKRNEAKARQALEKQRDHRLEQERIARENLRRQRETGLPKAVFDKLVKEWLENGGPGKDF